MAAQAKLLRAIQDLMVERVGGHGSRRVDTRIVAATNRPLAALAERGLFRTDLFYRLSGVDVRVPALRQRKEDILELACYFLSRHGSRGRLGLSAAASDALMAYDWPGNVRELERMIEGAIATCESGVIGLDDLPIALRGQYGEVLMPSVQANDTMRTWGSRYARLILERCNRNKRHACHVLGYHPLNALLNHQRGRPPDAVSHDPGAASHRSRRRRKGRSKARSVATAIDAMKCPTVNSVHQNPFPGHKRRRRCRKTWSQRESPGATSGVSRATGVTCAHGTFRSKRASLS
jgi:two-component system, NtrC family, response regulator HydG